MNQSGLRKVVICMLLISFLSAAAGLLIYSLRQNGKESDYRAEDLVITNLDVGKADAAVICVNGSTGLIDTGTEESVDMVDSYLKSRDISDIDYIVLSHFDKDHIGGAVYLLENYDVDEVYYPDYVSEKKLYQPLMDELEKKDLGTAVNKDTTINIDGVKMDIIPADDPEPLISDEDNRDNNMSLLCMLYFGDNKFLFTGDIEKDRIEQILSSSENLSADWIKIPYHGGFKKNEGDFLNRVSPVYAVISTSEERLPEYDLITYLKATGVRYYNTVDGDVTTVCDGSSIQVYQK